MMERSPRFSTGDDLAACTMQNRIHLPGGRKRWALSQREIAYLVGVNPAAISRYENGRLTPAARNLIALEIVFRRCGRRLFPSAYGQVEDAVMRRAAKLDSTLGNRTDPAAERKRAFLSRMASGGRSAGAA